jgi:hypothetical protein
VKVAEEARNGEEDCIDSAATLFSIRFNLTIEGVTHQPPKPLPRHTYHTNFFLSIFQSLWKILKTFQIIENTRNTINIVLILRICGVKVSKIQVEREGVVGDW